MATARLLISFLGLLQGRHVAAQPLAAATPAVAAEPAVAATPAVAAEPAAAATPAVAADTTTVAPGMPFLPSAEGTPVYGDIADPNCVVASYCSKNAGILTPRVRGLCVMNLAANQKQCWDACNLNHTIQSYYETETQQETQKAIAMMVKQLRTGTRFGSCPGSQVSARIGQVICNPGERCTPAGLTWGRGMCITIQNQGNQCLDMCDTSIPIEMYHNTPGRQEGTITTVRQVQSGRDPSGLTTCPGLSVWAWLWFPIVLCCLLGICYGTFMVFNYYRNRLKPAGRSYREPKQDYVEDQQPFVDYAEQGGMPQDGMMPQDGQYQDGMSMDMPPPQTGALEDPMPVIEQPAIVEEVVGPQGQVMLVEEKAPEVNLFDQPNLFGPGLAPLTVAAPAASYPMAGSNYITSYANPATTLPTAGYSQAGSMSVTGGYAAASRPQYVTGGSMTVGGGAMTTQLPYGSYGAYGGAAQTVYPGTTSMRIG